MTYGDVAAGLREQLTWLLERHRIGQHLGGPGSFRVPVSTTETERAALAQEVQRYRDAVLTYCLEAVRAVTPNANLSDNHRRRDPSEELRYRLETGHAALPKGQPLSSLMDQRSRFELVTRWQTAARLAVQGERETAALARAALSPEQQRVILKDAADLVRGLVVLDHRHRSVPGWTHLDQRGPLLTAADTAASQLTGSAVDLFVDDHGWRPTPGTIEGPALPGIAGVVQAQHNVVVDLTHFPSALNLRHVLVGQAQLANQAARVAQAVGSPTAATFEQRATLYRDLLMASRTLGGELGSGRHAALESANAAHRMTIGPATGVKVEKGLDQLVHLDRRVDARISAAVEHGFRERLYLTAIKLPTLDKPGPDGITRAANKYIPTDSPHQTELLALVRSRLAPVPPPAVTAAPDSKDSRAALTATLALERTPRRAPRC